MFGLVLLMVVIGGMAMREEPETSVIEMEAQSMMTANCADPSSLTTAQRRQCVKGWVNDERTQLGRDPLPLLDTLNWGAQAHTLWMYDHNSLEHSTDLGEQMDARLGIGWTWAGECIGDDGGSGFWALMNEFRNSPEHFAAITKPQADALGVGYLFVQGGHIWMTLWLVNRVGIT